MNKQLSCSEMGAPVIKDELSVQRDVPSRRILELHDTAVQHSKQGYWNDVCCHREQRETRCVRRVSGVHVRRTHLPEEERRAPGKWRRADSCLAAEGATEKRLGGRAARGAALSG